MRNFLMISITTFFVVFILVILPASLSSGKDITTEERGRVLGASEAQAGEQLEEFLKEYIPLSDDGVIEEEMTVVMKEPFKKENSEDVDIGEMFGIVIDTQTDKVLFDKKSEIQGPIASITKLMTALIFFDYNSSWDNFVEIENDDLIGGAQIYIKNGDEIEVKDLFNLSLIASANSATNALVRSTGLSELEFVEKMNEKARNLGLLKTEFVDPIGFSYKNISSPRDVSVLMKKVLENDFIAEVIQKKMYSFETKNGRLISVKNTDSLLSKYPKEEISILGGKTGFTTSAGYCFTGGFENEEGNKLISVVLGGSSYNSRFIYTDKIINWVYSNYEWR